MKPKIFIRRLLALTLLLLAGALLFSCAQAEAPGDITTTTEAPPAPPLSEIKIEELSAFTVIRPQGKQKMVSSDLAKDLGKLAGTSALPCATDQTQGFAEPDASALEILIGRTNRPESEEYFAALRCDDYGYALIGRKLVICGGSDQATKKAVELFTNEIVKAHDTENPILFSKQTERKIVGEYTATQALLNEKPLSAYTLVYPKNNPNKEQQYAQEISDRFLALGYTVDCVKDSEFVPSPSRPEIRIGSIDRASNLPENLAGDEMLLLPEESAITLNGGGKLGLHYAINAFLAQFEQTEGSLKVTMKETVKTAVKSDSPRTMTFNVWCAEITDDRVDRVISVIETALPDTFGVQEATPEWIAILKNRLPFYQFVGEGRDGGNAGEYSAVFYLPDRYTLLDSGTKWLSDTPDTVSKVPESSLPRIMSYAVLKRISDGKEFVHVNTHLEHTNEISRVKQTAVLLDQIKPFEGKPIIMTGDFNTNRDSEPYRQILAGGFVDAGASFGGEAGNKNTFPAGQGSGIIDFCFLRGQISVKGYSVFQDQVSGGYPSDHNPVIIDLEF